MPLPRKKTIAPGRVMASTYGGVTGLSVKLLAATASIFTAAATTFDTITATELGKLVALLPGYALATAKFYCHASCYGQCFARLSVGGSAVTLQGKLAPNFLGYEVVPFMKMTSSATPPTGKIGILFGAMEKAVALGDRREVTIRASDQRYFDNDQIVLIGTERFDINCHDVGDTTAAGALVAMKMA